MSALLKRAVDLQMVTPRHSRTLWMQLSSAGYKSREPSELDLPKEPPTLLKEIINTYVNDMGYKTKELATMLHLFENEIQDLYFDKFDNAEQLIKEAEDIIKSSEILKIT